MTTNPSLGKIPIMDRPTENWTSERLEQAACNELARHGRNKRDLDLLRTEFQKLRHNKSGDVVADDNTGSQNGKIPG